MVEEDSLNEDDDDTDDGPEGTIDGIIVPGTGST